MIAVYMLLTLTGFGLTIALARRRSRQAATAAVGTTLGVLAILTGFSIGQYVAVSALAMLAIAAAGLRPRSRGA